MSQGLASTSQQHADRTSLSYLQAEEKQPDDIKTQLEQMWAWIRQPDVAEKLGLTLNGRQCDGSTLSDMEKTIQQQVDKLEELMDTHKLQILVKH
jgi:hypothetical protein